MRIVERILEFHLSLLHFIIFINLLKKYFVVYETLFIYMQLLKIHYS